MEWSQAIVIIISIIVPMLTGFGWIIHRFDRVDQRFSSIEQRLSRLEGYLEGRDMHLKVKGE